MEEVERIPLVRKISAPADVIDLEEVEYEIRHCCQLWKLYAETSVELKRKLQLSRENAVTACKVYRQYISDVLQQVDEVMKLFAMEKELRIIKNRGHFPVPKITPQGTKIENTKDLDKVLEVVDKEVFKMTKAVRESEENYEKKKEEARNKEQQMRLPRQANRSDFNFLTMSYSTAIRNNNTIHHFYPMTNPTSHSDQYEPQANDSIIQGADSAPGGQFTTSTTGVTGHDKPWIRNISKLRTNELC